MLNVYVYDRKCEMRNVVPKNLTLVEDVEAFFRQVGFVATNINKKIVEYIDEGTLLNRYYFLDRYGAKISTAFLSTGSKAALMINNSNYAVSVLECGRNAYSAILSFCKSGNVVMPSPCFDFEDALDALPTEIMCDNRIFTSAHSLWGYLDDRV